MTANDGQKLSIISGNPVSFNHNRNRKSPPKKFWGAFSVSVVVGLSYP